MTLLLWVGSQVKLDPGPVAPPVPAALQEGSLTKGTSARLAPPLGQVHSISPGESLSINKTQQAVKQSPSSKRAQPSKVPLSRRVASTVPVPTKIKPERIYVPVYKSPPSQKQMISQPQTVNKASASASLSGASTQTLVGVFEFGDRSAALIDIDRITRRISLGETLTPDGWKLTKVDGQKVVLRRQGKLRTVYVGQSF